MDLQLLLPEEEDKRGMKSKHKSSLTVFDLALSALTCASPPPPACQSTYNPSLTSHNPYPQFPHAVAPLSPLTLKHKPRPGTPLTSLPLVHLIKSDINLSVPQSNHYQQYNKKTITTLKECMFSN